MRTIVFTIFIILYCQACNNDSPRETSTVETKILSKKSKRIDHGHSEYKRIVTELKSADKREIDYAVQKFIKNYPKSKFIDSLTNFQNTLKLRRDSIIYAQKLMMVNGPKYYFDYLNLPQFDTIDVNRYSLEYPDSVRFTDVDQEIFKNDFFESWYVSNQVLSDRYLTIGVGHFNDCENNIYLYSIDSSFNVLDKKEVFARGCYNSEKYNIPYEHYLVSPVDFELKSYFLDSTFTTVQELIYQLKDTTTNKIESGVGRREVLKYTIDKYGRFVQIDREFYQEPYAVHL